MKGKGRMTAKERLEFVPFDRDTMRRKHRYGLNKIIDLLMKKDGKIYNPEIEEGC